MKTLDTKEIEAPPGASPASAVIRVEDLHKYYEPGETRVHALRGVSLTIQGGEFLAIMGASGSGKSTFHEHPRMSGPADIGNLLPRRNRCQQTRQKKAGAH